MSGMKILVMGMNYTPECTGIAPFTTDLCEYLVHQGHQVFMFTSFPHYPEWKIHQDYRGKLFMIEHINGVRVYRCPLYVPSKPTTIRRIIYDTSLSLSILLVGLTKKDIDLILVISPPLQLGMTGYLLSKLRKTPFLLQIKDLIPDTALALGMIKNQEAIKLAYTVERFIYRKASAILVICNGFAENLRAKGVPNSKIFVLPDWVDTDFIRPLKRNNHFRQVQGLSDREFVVLHAGNMGAKQGLENTIDAAERLRDQLDISFFLVGGGSEKEHLMKLATSKKLTNVRFLPLQPRALLPHMLSAADVLLINQRADVVDMVIPSKLLNYMAAGRPIIGAVHPKSEAARYISWADCGLIIPPEKPEVLADAIRQLYTAPELAPRFGRNARAFAEEHFAKEKVLRRYAEVLSEIGNNRERGDN